MPHDRPIMDEVTIRNSLKPLDRLMFVGTDRFITQVAARRYYGKSQVLHQQVVQRRVGKHHSQVRIPRRNRRRQSAALNRLPSQQHDRCLRRAQQSFF